MASFCNVSRRHEPSILPKEIILKKTAVERQAANDGTEIVGALSIDFLAVQPRGAEQSLIVEHISGKIDVLNKVCAFTPLYKYPARQILQQAVFVFIGLQPVQQASDFFPKGVDQFLVARSPLVILQLNDQKHSPVGNILAIVVIGRVTHRWHGSRKFRQRRGKPITLQEIPFHPIATCQQCFCLCGKKAVTEPASSFSRRAIGKHVDGILRKGSHTGLEYLV